MTPATIASILHLDDLNHDPWKWEVSLWGVIERLWLMTIHEVTCLWVEVWYSFEDPRITTILEIIEGHLALRHLHEPTLL